jgi:hypothetical protein
MDDADAVEMLILSDRDPVGPSSIKVGVTAVTVAQPLPVLVKPHPAVRL